MLQGRLASLAKGSEHMSQLLIDLVSCYTPSQRERGAVDLLVNWMNAHDFSAHIDEVGNAVGRRGAANAPQTLMLLGHIDTFPGEIPVRVVNNSLYGRGSVDAKGSLCAFAEAAAQAQIPADWRVVVVGAVEEESATSKGARQIAKTYTPSLCIIGEPSGVSRITLGYKGRLQVDFTLTRPIAHTARLEPSAAESGVQFWNAVKQWSDAENAGIDRYFEQIMPSLRSINTSDDHFYETVSLTIGFRLPPRWSPEEVLETVKSFAPADATLNAYGFEYAYQTDRSNVLVRGLMGAIRAQSETPGFVLKTGTSDLNVVGRVWDCPIVAYGPGDSNLDHTPEEHLPLEEYQQAVDTLRHFIEYLS